MDTRTSPARLAIVNGKTAEEPDVQAALGLLAADDGPTLVRVTAAPGDAREFAREAAATGIGRIVVFGGDGTLSEVVSGLVAPAADEPYAGEVGIVPTGTANDFATCAGIPAGSPSDVVRELAAYLPRTIDVGRVSGAVETTFVNVATAGFGAEISSEASEELKGVLGRVSYLVAGLASAGDLEPREATLVAPDFERRLAFYLLAIGNARCAGGGMPVCPDADPSDGLFDVTVVPEGTVGATAAEIVRKGLEGVGDAGIRFRTPWLEVRTEGPLQVNLDGEPASGDEFRFEVQQGAVRVLLPPDSALLRPRDEG